MYTVMDFFRETIFRPLGGARPSHFYMYYRFTKACKRTPQLGRGSPKKFKSWKFKICPKIQRVRRNNFWASGSIFTGLFSVDVPRGGGDNLGTIFTTPAPKNLSRQKIVKNSARFLTSFDIDREYLRNGSTYQKSETLSKIYNHSHVGGKKVCVLRSTNDRVYSPNKFTP